MRKFVMFALLAIREGFTGSFGPVFTASLEKPVGFAWYDLEHFEAEVEGSPDVRPMIRSELNFPLDPFRLVVGMSSSRGADSAGRGGLRTGVQAWSAVGPAFFRMRDEDWTGARSDGDAGQSSQVLVKVSDTYSRSETFQFGGSFHRELGGFRFLGIPWAAGIGLGGSYYAYEVFGFEGKQRDSDGDWMQVEYPGSIKVLTYRTWAVRSVIGLRPRDRLLGWEWESWIHPLLHTRAFDDHILRMKDIEMECWGAGAVLEASLPTGRRLGPGGQVPRFAPYLRAEMERTWGNMTQTYYADSPDSPEDETGRSLGGINTSVGHWLVAAGLRLNLGP
jgi:hypothetical protein